MNPKFTNICSSPFNYFGYIPRSGIADHVAILWWIFHILTNTCYFLSLIIAILIGVQCYLIVVLIYISLMTNDIEHLFSCLLTIYIFFGKYIFKSFSCFQIGLFKNCYLVMSIKIFLDVNLLSELRFANISSHSVCCFFTLTVLFDTQKFLILMKSNLLFLM
jgi:hypothetical protein